MHGTDGRETGVDDDFAARSIADIGAWILGRNMFGPIRGDWPNEDWKGWWGDNPPYHSPDFVLTHYPRPTFRMEGGTVFHFVTEGMHSALERAKKAANGKNVRPELINKVFREVAGADGRGGGKAHFVTGVINKDRASEIVNRIAERALRLN